MQQMLAASCSLGGGARYLFIRVGGRSWKCPKKGPLEQSLYIGPRAVRHSKLNPHVFRVGCKRALFLQTVVVGVPMAGTRAALVREPGALWRHDSNDDNHRKGKCTFRNIT